MIDEQSLVSTNYPRREVHTRSQAWEQVLDVAIVQADISEIFTLPHQSLPVR
jgi:hypothetical protein